VARSPPTTRRDRGDVAGDPDLVADDDAARLERLVPAEAELAAADLAAQLDSDSVFARGIALDTVDGGVEGDRHRLAVDGQIAAEPVVALLTCSIFVERKDISGWFSTSKKSAERRCASRSAELVSIEAVAIVPQTRESCDALDPIGRA
jgi:hypothetical protein